MKRERCGHALSSSLGVTLLGVTVPRVHVLGVTLPLVHILGVTLLCIYMLGATTACQESPPAHGVVKEDQEYQSPNVVEPAPTGEALIPLQVRRADYAITKLNLGKADKLLDGEIGPDAARARARLAIYRADCEGALSQLASSAAKQARGADLLFDLATRCSGATAGSIVVESGKDGVWLRIQDRADRVLAPLLIDVAIRARDALEKDLGTYLPRPLRIDLVRDLFSLAAVSGLPLDAAETTGTVAVARWGRVTMVSPRAMQRGFPWADTLAHEITHLLLSRATADRAPLWLQEGIAKREERRWREAQAFDDATNYAEQAYQAEREGKAVGVDSIGPSIAMLPSAEAASIAFAEVTAYMDYWIVQNGPSALPYLLREMEIAADADAAMRGVSGFGVAEWQLLWRDHLREKFKAPEISEEVQVGDNLGPRALARAMRLTELLTLEGFPNEAAELASSDLDRASHAAAFRFMMGRAAVMSGRDDSDLLLGKLSEIDEPHAGWLALRAAQIAKDTTSPEAERFFSQARSLDPLLPEVVCKGVPWVGKPTTKDGDVRSGDIKALENAQDPCTHAKMLPVRGSY